MISENVMKRHVGCSCAYARVVMAVKTSFKSPVSSLPDEPHHLKDLMFIWKVQGCSLFSAEPVFQYLAILSASVCTQRMCVYIISSVFTAVFVPECSRNDLGKQNYPGGACPQTSLEGVLYAHSFLCNTLPSTRLLTNWWLRPWYYMLLTVDACVIAGPVRKLITTTLWVCITSSSFSPTAMAKQAHIYTCVFV